MDTDIPVFVNGRSVRIARGADALAAVAAAVPDLLERVRAGAASVTDARGLAVEPEAPLAAGAILRVAVSARHTGEADASA